MKAAAPWADSITPGAALVVAAADHPRLPSVLRERARAAPVVLVTDDRDRLPPFDGPIAVLEPEDLLDGDPACDDTAFVEGVTRWLDQMFPGTVAGIPLSRIFWTNVFRSGGLFYRNNEVALTERLLAQVNPSSLDVLGEPPYCCQLLPDEARRRGIPVRAPDELPRRVADVWQLLRGVGRATALVARNLVRLPIDVRNRRNADRQLASILPPHQPPTRLWLALCAMWVQPVRHMLNSIVASLEREGQPYSLLFHVNYGQGKGSTRDRNLDEKSLLDGQLGKLAPNQMGQIAGLSRWRDIPLVLVEWLSMSARCTVAVLRHHRDCRVGGVVASVRSDLPALLQCATTTLLRVLEIRTATARWIADHPEIHTVVLHLAHPSEYKMGDLMLQQAGINTIHYAHGYMSEANLVTTWPLYSTYNVLWTEEQAALFRPLGWSRHCVGGYLPWARAATVPRGQRLRILVGSAYPLVPFQMHNLKYARRLARALADLDAQLGDRVELRVRLHPLDDREAWRRHFAPGDSPPLSTNQALGDDLAWADVVLASVSSLTVEALLYEIPVLVHRGPLAHPGSIFGQVPAERWFADGPQLIERIQRILAGELDLAIEERLRRLCFGASGRPRPLIDLLREIGALSGSQFSVDSPAVSG